MEEIERREHYGTSPSLRQRGYVPLAGVAHPCVHDTDLFLPDALGPCGDYGAYWKPCNGGTFSCWDHGRQDPRGHADFMCMTCGFVWTDWVPR